MLKLIPTPQFAEISETKTLKQILFQYGEEVPYQSRTSRSTRMSFNAIL